MKHFTASGLWYLAEEPDNRVSGTLHFSEDGLLLELIGTFKGGWSAGLQSYPLIYGVTGKTPYGSFVTLLDSFMKRSQMYSSSISTETVRCNFAVVGNAHFPPDHEPFDSLDITLGHLDDWFGRSGISANFSPEEAISFTVQYRKIEPMTFDVRGTILNVGVTANSHRAIRSAAIEEYAHISVRNLPRLTVKEVLQEYVRPLQNLLSFATDRPNEVEETELYGPIADPSEPARRREYHPIYSAIYRAKKSFLTSHDMLFMLDEAREASSNIFETWFEFTKRHQAFCTVYFAYLYAPPKYLEEKFLRLMSAFRLLAASLAEVSPQTTRFLNDLGAISASCFTEEERRLLQHLMPVGFEIEMPFFMLRALEERAVMSQVVGDDFPEFVKSVTEMMAYVERRPPGAESFSSEGGLYDAMHKVQFLIKILVLKELGFGPESITKLIKRSSGFSHVKLLLSHGHKDADRLLPAPRPQQ